QQIAGLLQDVGKCTVPSQCPGHGIRRAAIAFRVTGTDQNNQPPLARFANAFHGRGDGGVALWCRQQCQQVAVNLQASAQRQCGEGEQQQADAEQPESGPPDQWSSSACSAAVSVSGPAVAGCRSISVRSCPG